VNETDNIFYRPGYLSVILEEPSGFDFTLFEQLNIEEQMSVKTGIQSPPLDLSTINNEILKSALMIQWHPSYH